MLDDPFDDFVGEGHNGRRHNDEILSGRKEEKLEMRGEKREEEENVGMLITLNAGYTRFGHEPGWKRPSPSTGRIDLTMFISLSDSHTKKNTSRSLSPELEEQGNNPNPALICRF